MSTPSKSGASGRGGGGGGERWTPAKAPAEDKVRVILRELRQKNVHLEQELTELERTLSVRTKRKLGTKHSMSDSPKAKSPKNKNGLILRPKQSQRVERCRTYVEPKVASKVERSQKLVFGLVDVRENLLDSYCDDAKQEVTLVGPKDLKRRTGGVLRIGDHVLSLDYTLVSDLPKADSEDHFPVVSDDARPAPSAACEPSTSREYSVDSVASKPLIQRRFEAYLDRAARNEPPEVVFGVLRNVVHIMAVGAGRMC
ncbi:Protein MPZ-1 d [Aphelenchoides avenae]|nr:Protein MPZ-1 d [Aphelenchus avenae]